MVKNLFKKEILYSRLSQAAKAFAAAPSPCPKPWQAIKCHRGRVGVCLLSAAKLYSTISSISLRVKQVFHIWYYRKRLKIAVACGMWMQTIKNSCYSCIQVSWPIDNTYLWLGKGFQTGKDWLFMVPPPSIDVFLPPCWTASQGKPTWKHCIACWQRNFTPKDFFFKWSISPGCLVHLPECILSIEERLSHVFCGRADL